MFFKLFFDWSWHSVLCFIGFGCTAQWLNICINGPVFLPPTCSWSIEMQLACVLICYPVTLINSLSVKWSPDLLIRCPGFRIHVREEHRSVTFLFHAAFAWFRVGDMLSPLSEDMLPALLFFWLYRISAHFSLKATRISSVKTSGSRIFLLGGVFELLIQFP